MFRKDLEMKLLQNLKKDKKGFTLIEMIVVIVIIGILLAILVPGMFKYIERAKEKQVEVDARTAYLEAQIEFADEFAKKVPDYTKINVAHIKSEAGVLGNMSIKYDPNTGKILEFKYGDSKSKKSVTYDVTSETWTVGSEEVTDSITT